MTKTFEERENDTGITVSNVTSRWYIPISRRRISADTLLNRLLEILGLDSIKDHFKIAYSSLDNRESSLLMLRKSQKELRLLKAEVALQMIHLRSEIAEELKQLDCKGYIASQFAGTKTVQKRMAEKRATIKRKYQCSLDPYERLNREIDRILAELRRLRWRLLLDKEPSE